jgi:hypothetical protein
MKRLFVVFFVFFLGCAGPGGPLPEVIDSPHEPADSIREARSRFRPYLKTTTSLHCLLVGGPINRGLAGGGHPVFLSYLNPQTSQPHLRLIGTDLGFAFTHQGSNIILFGDTWPLPTTAYDDSLATFPTPERGACPILTFPSEAEPPESLPVRPIMVYRRDAAGERTPYPMGALKTPLTGFSSGDAAYGIFGVGAQTCPCDTGDICLAGLCYAPAGHVRAQPLSIAAASPLPDFYEEGLINLRDFVNISARVVPHFDPENPAANVYYLDPTISFEEQAIQPALLVWGKPAFGSLVNTVPTYLMYYDLSATGEDRWMPHYYTGTVEGIPQWSTVSSSEKIAPGLTAVITAGSETIEGTPIRQPWQISVSFVSSLNKWIMLYGCRPPGNARGISFADNPKVGIYMREADHPWGPWSAARRIWSAVADGGHTSFMFHSVKNPNAYDYELSGSTYIPDHPTPRNNDYNYGYEYGASIIDSLTWHDAATGKTHIYWAMSTGNPYRVVLMHTVLEYSFRVVR